MANTTLTNIAAELTQVAARLRLRTVKVKSGSLGVGSGVIWQPDGLIITNAHVATSNRATVELSDGRIFDAVRTQFDPQQDLAALKIAATDLTAATIGNSEELRVGELVLAVGNPFADSGAVTTGIIYANNQQAVMADLHLYPGNSGGPLADCLGRVVGINTMIVNGLAVAVPSSTVEGFLHGNSRLQLGVTLQPVLLDRRSFNTVRLKGKGKREKVLNTSFTPYPLTFSQTTRKVKSAYPNRIDRSLGLLVLSILPDSAAEVAGVQIGDVLIGISGRLFTSINDLTKYFHHSKGSVPLQLRRGGQQFVIDVAVQSGKTAVEAT